MYLLTGMLYTTYILILSRLKSKILPQHILSKYLALQVPQKQLSALSHRVVSITGNYLGRDNARL